MTLSFPTETGLQYQLQSTTNLPAASWENEGAVRLGTGGLMATNLVIGPQAAKFFRVQASE